MNNLFLDKVTFSDGNKSITIYGDTATIANAIIITSLVIISTAIVFKALQ
jgi:hypothetical protein